MASPRLRFTKMQGSGNDFVVIDATRAPIALSAAQVRALADRRLGVGCDQVLLVESARSPDMDFYYRIFNADGGEVENCGNGARCFARFIQKVAGANGKTSFETGAGIITATFQGERVTVNLTQPKHLSLSEKVAGMLIHSLNTGVPHAVIFVPDADKAMVQQLGAEIRYHPHFAPKGTNVNFAQVLGPNHIRVRTYERGVEGETLACGTGVTASALIASRVHGFKAPVKVTVQGGDVLEVDFREAGGEFTDVQLTGPAEFVYDGRIEV